MTTFGKPSPPYAFLCCHFQREEFVLSGGEGEGEGF